jgi:hypothetical protein
VKFSPSVGSSSIGMIHLPLFVLIVDLLNEMIQ